MGVRGPCRVLLPVIFQCQPVNQLCEGSTVLEVASRVSLIKYTIEISPSYHHSGCGSQQVGKVLVVKLFSFVPLCCAGWCI